MMNVFLYCTITALIVYSAYLNTMLPKKDTLGNEYTPDPLTKREAVVLAVAWPFLFCFVFLLKIYQEIAAHFNR